MCFNKWKLVLTGILLCLAACTPKIGEQPPPSTVGDLGGTECLTDAADAFKSYFLGEASDREMNAAWDCVDQAFNQFNKYVRGSEQDKYYIHELVKFFEDYFIEKDGAGAPVNKISVDLQRDLMKVKQLFLDGSRDYISREELTQVATILSRLRSLSIRLNPYMKIYTQKWVPSHNESDDIEIFDQANAAIQDFAKEISSLIVPNHEAYSFEDFFNFLRHLSGFYNETWPYIEDVQKYLPIVYKIKSTVTGGAEDRVRPGEWRSFLLLGARAYIQYVRYFYFLKEKIDLQASLSLRHIARAVEDLLGTLEDLVREKPSHVMSSGRKSPEGRITKQELKELFESMNEVWPKFVVSDGLLNEAMVVKQVFFGGSGNQWAFQDFAKAKSKINILYDILEKVMPYHRVYTIDWDPQEMTWQEAQKHFTSAHGNLKTALFELGGIFEAPYALANLEKLLEEIEKQYPLFASDIGTAVEYKKYFPLGQLVKNILFEDTGDVIQKSQWPHFLSFGGQVYTLYLRSHYFIEDKKFQDLSTLTATKEMGLAAMMALQDFVAVKPSHLLKVGDIQLLLLESQKLEMLPAKITKDSFLKTTTSLVNSLLNPSARRLAGGNPDGFDQQTVDYLRQEFLAWIETEIFLRGLYNSTADSLTPQQLHQIIDGQMQDPQVTPTLLAGLGEMKRVIPVDVPMVLDLDYRLRISAGVRSQYDFISSSRLNMTRALSRLLIAGYAMDPTRIAQGVGVTQAEAQGAFDQLKWVFIDLEQLQADNLTFVESRFIEANVFVPRGDGDDFASFIELSDILNAIFSGTVLDVQLRSDLLAECLPGVKDPPPATTMNYQCLVKNYLQNMPNYFSSMVDFQSYMRANDPCLMESAFYDLIKASGYVPNLLQKVSLIEIALVPHIIQYLEFVMRRYDLNHDGKIDQSEADNAFPVFRHLFWTMAEEAGGGLITESDLYPLFTYVLKYGTIPDDAASFVKFKIWKALPSRLRIFTVDRNHLSKILGVVADKVSAEGAVAPLSVAQARIEARQMKLQHMSQACQPPEGGD